MKPSYELGDFVSVVVPVSSGFDDQWDRLYELVMNVSVED